MPTQASTNASDANRVSSVIIKLRNATECTSTWSMERILPTGMVGSTAASVWRTVLPRVSGSRREWMRTVLGNQPSKSLEVSEDACAAGTKAVGGAGWSRYDL